MKILVFLLAIYIIGGLLMVKKADKFIYNNEIFNEYLLKAKALFLILVFFIWPYIFLKTLKMTIIIFKEKLKEE